MGDAQPKFVNRGTLRRTAGVSNTDVSFGFENQGSVSVETGTVNFLRGASGAVSRGSWSSSGTSTSTSARRSTSPTSVPSRAYVS